MAKGTAHSLVAPSEIKLLLWPQGPAHCPDTGAHRPAHDWVGTAVRDATLCLGPPARAWASPLWVDRLLWPLSLWGLLPCFQYSVRTIQSASSSSTKTPVSSFSWAITVGQGAAFAGRPSSLGSGQASMSPRHLASPHVGTASARWNRNSLALPLSPPSGPSCPPGQPIPGSCRGPSPKGT